ncbi:hypothetical protein UP09_07080 [Bradyrhizobium sp. LTSP885]|uniref:hypothetical protein n=1 Tax=Bradyrhizobium sp. LTSP885 TaxID=1619232 RepID=UPI0005C81897|nr:hypothetical protein [Bradyrhizobium sp. LTSP885]KJC49459.1 hypothetical protein UP09_07080 [Bradyrhizobium sp. LTSP885]
MHQLTLLRMLGACTATALVVYTGLSFYGDLVRPSFRPSELFMGQTQPVEGSRSTAGFAARLSVDGDLLANSAAMKAAKVLQGPATDATHRAEENKEAQDAAIAALEVSPIRPALWLTLGMLRAGSSAQVAPVLKMSYLAGTVPLEVALARLQTVTSTAAASDEEIRLLALSDIRSTLAGGSRFEAPLIATYVQATPEGKSLLLDATQAINPKFNAALRRY